MDVASLTLSRMLGLAVVVLGSCLIPLGPIEAQSPVGTPLYPLTDDNYISYPLPPSAPQYGSISGKRMKADVNELVAISRQSHDDGNQFLGRITGTQYDAKARQWVMAKMKKIGLETREEPMQLPPMRFPSHWEFSVATPQKGHNPQFLFSSGQRRAAGLAFLLAVHLSRPWCKWRSLLMDDPVQHIDDYRSLNLVEVLAAIRRSGRQVIVAVEDQALADVLCRRLRSANEDGGRHFELRTSETGTSVIGDVHDIYPMPRLVLRPAQEGVPGLVVG